MQNIVILTGAGISAESGLGTFRDADGLWARHRIEDVATPQGFARNPALVHRFYNARRAQAAAAIPNAAHDALTRLQSDPRFHVTIVTQNVDALHEAAGARALHMHGTLAGAICAGCGATFEAPKEMSVETVCPGCAMPGAVRPDVVWFGEIPHHLDRIAEHLAHADLFAAIGTSGQVYPAAGFVQEAASHGAMTVELTLEPSDISGWFQEQRHGLATRTVPIWVDEVLGAV